MVQVSAASSKLSMNFRQKFLSRKTIFEKETALVLFSHDPKLKTWFRLFPFRSPLLRESRLLSFPSATKMFQFTELSLSHL